MFFIYVMQIYIFLGEAINFDVFWLAKMSESACQTHLTCTEKCQIAFMMVESKVDKASLQVANSSFNKQFVTKREIFQHLSTILKINDG